MDMFTIKAQTISGGIALGKVLNFVPVRQVEQKKALPPEARAAEAASLRSAVQAACAELNVAVEEIKRTLGEDKAAIFACHLDILMDQQIYYLVFFGQIILYIYVDRYILLHYSNMMLQ